MVRALQTVRHYADYRLPSTEGDFEIDNSPYKLKSWIADAREKSGIDEHDPLRLDISPIQSLPSHDVSRHFDLEFAFEDQPKWRRKTSGEAVFEYRAWSDIQLGDSGERIIFDDRMYSTGYELVIDSKALTEYLSKVEMDLIIEIQTTRSNRGDETRYDQKDAKELVFDRVILLRRDGTIEAAEGCLGTWKSSGTRVKAP